MHIELFTINRKKGRRDYNPFSNKLFEDKHIAEAALSRYYNSIGYKKGDVDRFGFYIQKVELTKEIVDYLRKNKSEASRFILGDCIAEEEIEYGIRKKKDELKDKLEDLSDEANNLLDDARKAYRDLDSLVYNCKDLAGKLDSTLDLL